MVSINKIITTDQDRLEQDEILEIVKHYFTSDEYQRLKMYNKYYEGENSEILRRYNDKKSRGKTPNNLIPTSYYSTIIDTMAGYMMNNIVYSEKNEESKKYAESLNEVLNDNNVDVKDMSTGLRGLAYNKGVEYVYTVGDGENEFDIRYTSLKPDEVIFIYTDDIEPVIYCGIRIIKRSDDEYKLEVIYKDLIQSYNWNKTGAESKEKELIKDVDDVDLYFNECPLILYNTNLLSLHSPFHRILTYIDALDILISGNSNEVDRLVDAILVLGKRLKQDDLINMEEWKTLEGMKKEDRAEFLTKDMTPDFRKYVSDLLVREIHKHSHVIDWYSEDFSSGEASARALRTRLFDMDMYSRKIEKIYKEGVQKRIRLINDIFRKTQGIVDDIGEIEIIFNRTVPSDFEDKVQALSGVDFLSKQTKVEEVGKDWDVEKERLSEEETPLEPVELEQRQPE